jgi:hypothetical protein
LSAFLLVLAADEYYWTHAFQVRPVREVAGKITGLDKSRGKDSTDYYIVYSYEDTNGRRHTAVSEADGAIWRSVNVGAPVRVEVLAGDEERSRLPEGRSEFPRDLSLGLGGLLFAALIGWSRNSGGSSRHIRLEPLPSAPAHEEPDRVFRAYIKEHWPFSLLLVALGLMLLYASCHQAALPGDSALLGVFFMVPAGLFLLALPLIMHFCFYVKLTDDHLEARGLGPARRVAWRELTDVWSSWTPQADFAGSAGSLSINFKLFPRECRQAVRERIHEMFGESV